MEIKTREDISKLVVSCFSEHVGIQATEETRLSDLKLDSLDIVELSFSMEEKSNIDMEDTDAVFYGQDKTPETLGVLIDLLDAKINPVKVEGL